MTDPIRPNSEEPEDLNLVAFLKSNRPPVPPPHPGAEARLMERIAQSQQVQTHNAPRSKQRGWMIAAIALISALVGTVLWQFRSQNTGVFVQREIELEAFLIESWQDVSEEDSLPELDWLSTPAELSQTESVFEPLAYQSYSEESYP